MVTSIFSVSQIFTQSHDSAGYYGFMLDVRVSVRPSVSHTSIRFSFPDDSLSKHQWIFTKLGMCIDIVEVWFGIANGQISSNFMELSAYNTILAGIIVYHFYFPVALE